MKALLSYPCKLEMVIVLHSIKWYIRVIQYLKPQKVPSSRKEQEEQLGIHMVELFHVPHIHVIKKTH